MPNAAGLFETHLTVSDLDRSIEFYRDSVGLTLALELPERGAAFFWIGGAGEAMLGLWSFESAPIGLALRFYQLAGFRMRSVERDAFTAMVGYPAGLMANGIQVRDRVWLDLQLNPART